MRTIKYLILAIIFVMLTAAIVGLFLPSHIQMSRSIEVNRKVETVYQVVNSMQQFNNWSPWAEKDPEASFEYSGAESGVGSKMNWKGNPEIGEGYQIITESVQNQKVVTEMSFGASQRKAQATILLKDLGEKTQVEWIFEMDAGNNLIKRYSGLAIEDLLAADFESGLVNLKEHVESLPLFEYSNISVETLNAIPVYALKIPIGIEQHQLADEIAQAYGKIINFLTEHNLSMAGAPVMINEMTEDQGQQLIAAIPVSHHIEVSEGSDILDLVLPEGRTVRLVHQGSYDELPKSYGILNAYVFQNQLKVRGHSWESYVTDPGTVSEQELITHLYLPVQK